MALALLGGLLAAPIPGHAAVLPLDGSWIVLDESMSPGDFFSRSFDFVSERSTEITITDLFVVSDQYEIYDFGGLIATTPAKPDWPALGAASPFTAPPFTPDPDVAFASGVFSSIVLHLPAGAHSLTIRDIHIPPIAVGAGPFPDGTVAIKGIVPLPATALLLGLGMTALGMGSWRRRPS